MTETGSSSSTNARFLELNGVWAYAALRARLAVLAGDDPTEHQARRAEIAAMVNELWDPESVPLVAVSQEFGLSDIEGQLVGLLLARALDPGLGPLLSELNGSPELGLWSPHAVAEVLADGSVPTKLDLLSALNPDSKLRVVRILQETAWTEGLVTTPLRLTRACIGRLLAQEVTGPYYTLSRSDDPLSGPGYTVLPERTTADTRLIINEHMLAWKRDDRRVTGGNRGMMVLICGESGTGRKTFANELARELFAGTVMLDAMAASHAPEPLRVLRSAFDAAVIYQFALIIDNGDALFADGPGARYLLRCVEQSQTCVFIVSQDHDLAPCLAGRWVTAIRLQQPTHDLIAQLWEAHLPSDVDIAPDVDLGALAERYVLSNPAIGAAARSAVAAAGAGDGRVEMHHLALAAERQLGGDMGKLVRTIRPRRALTDLVLPEDVLEEIHRVISAARHWHEVLSHWGLSKKVSTGRCVSCLFHGEPGTGKTLAAEIIAGALETELHIVSLPSIMSKWLGESERNVSSLFALARQSDAILLFDEADALFASRVQAETSQDHGRNMLTSLMLQELDRHTGVVILTTNFTRNIDTAFQRRLMFDIEFPLPDETARGRIFAGLLPAEMPQERVDIERLAQRFEVSGGHIKNIVVRAALRAWAAGCAVQQDHLETEGGLEYRRLGKLF
jgi:DNA polymerase III delta prime subunit